MFTFWKRSLETKFATSCLKAVSVHTFVTGGMWGSTRLTALVGAKFIINRLVVPIDKRHVNVRVAPNASHEKRTCPTRLCTASKLFQTSLRPRFALESTICMHFKKSKHLLRSEVSWWCVPTMSYMLRVKNFDTKGTISEVRAHTSAKFVPSGFWPNANSKFSTEKSCDHHGTTKKEIVKK